MAFASPKRGLLEGVKSRYSAAMKPFLLVLAIAACSAHAQVVPTTPTKFGTRNLGASNTSSSTVSGSSTSSAAVGTSATKPATTVHTIIYIGLSSPRQWTSSEGKPLLAKLIAFEDLKTETPAQGATAPTLPKLTGKPTVVNNGKVRLLVDQKPYEVELDKLSATDREFVDNVKRAVETSK